MKVKYNGKEYDIKFFRSHRSCVREKRNFDLIDSGCAISLIHSDKNIPEEKYEGLVVGETRQSHLDSYNKALGFKISFNRAVTNLNSKDKSYRTALWSGFKEVYGEKLRMT